jgi:hypothetical protein
MASLQGEFAGTVVTGLRRSEAMVAPWKASFLLFLLSERRRVTFAASGVSGGVSGRRSLAASQSSSTNYQNVSGGEFPMNELLQTLLR